jgi:hypothetical protein
VNAKLDRMQERGAALQSMLQTNIAPIQAVAAALLVDKGFFWNGSAPSKRTFDVRSAAVVFTGALARAMQLVGTIRVNGQNRTVTVPRALNMFHDTIAELFRRSCSNPYRSTPAQNSSQFVYVLVNRVIPSILLKDKEVLASMKTFAVNKFFSEREIQQHVQRMLQQSLPNFTDLMQYNAVLVLGIAFADFCAQR